MSTDAPLRWGIISTAAIGLNHVLPALAESPDHEIVAIGSRSQEMAAHVASQFDIEQSHGSYDDVLADDDVEAIYIPLPNHLHVDWAKRGIDAGKHVLCEKPIALDAVEAQGLADYAASRPELVVMEAFMYRFHPQWIAARQLVRDGAIGDLVTISTFFSYFNDDPANIRHKKDWGGGGLMDIGCYPISQARWIFDAEPVRVVGSIETDTDFGVDRLASGMLEFETGTATFTCSTRIHGHQRAQIVGTAGRIEVDIPVNSPKDRPTNVTLFRDGADAEVKAFGPADQYQLQANAFRAAVRAGGPAPTPLSDAVSNMAVIDAAFASADHGGWVDLG